VYFGLYRAGLDGYYDGLLIVEIGMHGLFEIKTLRFLLERVNVPQMSN
jgi:hypothetical protein